MIDIKAIREAAEAADINHMEQFHATANPATVIALCDEIERLREQIGAYQLHEKQLLAAKQGLECEVERMRADAAAYHALRAELDKKNGSER